MKFDAASRARRRAAPKPPLGVAIAYSSLLKGALARQQAKVARVVARRYQGPARTDAAADGDGSLSAELAAVQIEVATRSIATLAKRVVKANGEAHRRMLQIPRTEKRVPGISRAEQGIEKAAVDGFRARNIGLIKSLQADQLDDVRELLDEATVQGWHVDELLKQLEGRFSVARSRAELIARDQTLKLNGQLSQMRQQRAGITHYTWSTSEDERVRPAHAELDGRRISWDLPPVVDESGRTAHPGDDFQCRCVAIAVVPWLDDEEG